jgi:uncharacterized protein (UPF0261 family)
MPEGDLLPRAFTKRQIYRYDYRWCIRASVKEVARVARWIGTVLDKARPKHAILLIPLGGLSDVGVRGGQYYSVELVEAFRKQMVKHWDAESIIDVDLPLDDPRFARLASEHLYGLMRRKWKM